MKIIINENQLKLIVEKLGVPDNITKTAEKFYYNIINELSAKNEYASDSYLFTISGDFNVGNFNFNKFIIYIYFNKNDNADKLLLYKETLSFNPELKYTKSNNNNNKYHFNINKPNTSNSNIQLHFAAPNDIKYSEIVTYMINNKNMVISEISHELMHLYEKFNKNTENIYARANYDAIQSVGTGIKPLDEMIFSFYYLSKIELITRPSEIFSYLKSQNTTKSNFMSNLKNNKVYNKLLVMKNINLNDIIMDMKLNYTDKINELFENDTNLNSLSIDDKIKHIFKVIYITIANHGIERLGDILITNPIEQLFGLSDDKNNMIIKYQNNLINKQNNYMKYFNNQIKKTNFYSNKMIKKIHKLYDLFPDDNNSSIRNIEEWTLNQNINNVKKININDKLKGT